MNKQSQSVNFFAEVFDTVGDLVFEVDTDKTGDIVTTIEPSVARMLDRELETLQREWGSE